MNTILTRRQFPTRSTLGLGAATLFHPRTFAAEVAGLHVFIMGHSFHSFVATGCKRW
jgi:hypothetical protein